MSGKGRKKKKGPTVFEWKYWSAMAEKLTPSWSSGRRKGKPGRRVKSKPWFGKDTRKALDSAMDIFIYLIYFGLLILFLRVLAALADSICGCANLWRLLKGGAQMVVGSPFLTLPRPQALVGPWPGELEASLRWARGTRLVLEDKDSEAVITGYTGTVAAYICRLGVPSGNTHEDAPLGGSVTSCGQLGDGFGGVVASACTAGGGSG